MHQQQGSTVIYVCLVDQITIINTLFHKLRWQILYRK